MASPAKNKSSASSPLIPCRPNPKARNSEVGDQMRRSFRGSPIGDKENNNEKEQSSSMAKSLLPTPKSAKNFMSPTISTVSKINPSPRKRVLSDRNEGSRSSDNKSLQVRSSVSFSDVISIIGNGEEDADHEQISVEEESHDITIIDVKEAVETRRCLESDENKSNGDFDSSFRVSPRPSFMYTSPVVLSHEVDDSLVPPYDPKKNYLSPRPQFLHYRPNPRIELHLDECKQLEELFMSETSSDTELSTEETQSENSEEQEQEEGGAAAEVVVMEDVEAVNSDEEEMVCESNEETHQITKQCRFRTFKWLGWLLLSVGVVYLLLVSSAAIAVPNQLSIVKDLAFYEFYIPPEITKSAKDSFEQLSEKLGMWAQSSLVYIDRLILSLGEVDEYSPLVFHNLTDILEDGRLLSDAVFEQSSPAINDGELDSQNWSLEMDIKEENRGRLLPEEPKSEEFDDEASHINGDEVNSSEVEQIEIKMGTEMNGDEVHSEAISKEESGGQETDVVDSSSEWYRESEETDEKNMEEAESDATYLDQHDVDHIQEEIEAEITGNNLEFSHEDAAAIYIEQRDVESSTINGHIQEEIEVSNSDTGSEEVAELFAEVSDVEYEDLSSESCNKVDDNGLEEVGLGAGSDLSEQKKMIIVFSSTVLVLVAATIFLFTKKVKPVSTVVQEEAPAIPEENLIKQRVSSLDDRIVKPCSPEMSFSYHKSNSFQSGNRDDDDTKEESESVESMKSNKSNESMASSASISGSVSYGSFTTYEKISKRSGYKEKEMITPVRRSSRIRSHQHSGL